MNITILNSRTDSKPKSVNISWEEIVIKLRHAKMLAITRDELNKLSKEAQGKIKDIGGYVGGEFLNGSRKSHDLKSRCLLTLDADFADSTFVDIVKAKLSKTTFVLYPTFSHCPSTGKYRYRLVIPFTEPVSPEEYEIIAAEAITALGEHYFDPTTTEPSRLMFWPCVAFGEDYTVYTNGSNEAKPLDISRYKGRALSRSLVKAEDPTQKSGLIGLFCRTYTISEAIDTFLSDVYKRGTAPNRYTLIKGEAINGLVIYDNDTLAYSNHATDVAGQKALNAFDIVRIHKFGHMDANSKANTPVAKLHSYVEMTRLIEKDKKCQRVKEDEFAKEVAKTLNVGEEEVEWIKTLRYKKNTLIPSIVNFKTILENDPRLKSAVYRDEFTGYDMLERDLPWRKKEEGKFWTNADESSLALYFSDNYEIEKKENMLTALDAVCDKHKKHPVRAYLNELPKWDKVPRLETLFIDYLGCPDTELTRQQTRKHLIAAIARILNPGVKYDYVLTLKGAEGIGKSTIIRMLAKDTWFSDSIASIEGKDAMEAIQGKWLIEFSELVNYSKSTNETYKSFISKTTDDYRPAYARKTERKPRQCVFFATTNEDYFLKGTTGNRRFWVLECGVNNPKLSIWEDLPLVLDQIWAEALYYYKQGEKLTLPYELVKLAEKEQSKHNELNEDSRKAMIEEFIRTPIPDNWYDLTPEQKVFKLRTVNELEPEYTKKREFISAVEILYEMEGRKLDNQTRYKTREINAILKSIDWLEEKGRLTLKGYGRQQVFKVAQ